MSSGYGNNRVMDFILLFAVILCFIFGTFHFFTLAGGLVYIYTAFFSYRKNKYLTDIFVVLVVGMFVLPILTFTTTFYFYDDVAQASRVVWACLAFVSLFFIFLKRNEIKIPTDLLLYDYYKIQVFLYLPFFIAVLVTIECVLLFYFDFFFAASNEVMEGVLFMVLMGTLAISLIATFFGKHMEPIEALYDYEA